MLRTAPHWCWVALLGLCTSRAVASETQPPNVIVVLADDLGYGDLSCFGSRAIHTKVLDRMAAEGIRLTAFTTTSAVCSPSRAALLTGRYGIRCGIFQWLSPKDSTGLPAGELTLAEALHAHGYATAMVGKWHLGHLPDAFPTRHGFDLFYGLPSAPEVYRNEKLVQANAYSTLPRTLTEESVRFIHEHARHPFFLYFAQTLVHEPVLSPPGFHEVSGAGPYGDVVLALDWSMGQVLDALHRDGIERNTLVIFLSDNGPGDEGSAGGLRGRKGSVYEGGFRVPCIARWPARIHGGSVSDEPVNALDLFPTILAAAGISPPAGRLLDGDDVLPLLTGAERRRPARLFFYFDRTYLEAARFGPWKIHLGHHDLPCFRGAGPNPVVWLARPELYDLSNDPGESYDLGADHEDVMVNLIERIREGLRTLPDSVVAPLWSPARSAGPPPARPPGGEG